MIYAVSGQPDPRVPVYIVEPEDGYGRTQTLHRNMIFPLALPLDDENQSIGMYKSSSCRSHTKPKYPVASDLFA